MRARPSGARRVARLTAAALLLAGAAPAHAQLDPGFGSAGVVTTPIGGTGVLDVGLGVARQTDGKLVVVGATNAGVGFGTAGDFAVARYNADGSLDTTFDGDGRASTSFVADANKGDEARAVAIQSDGRIVVAGLADTPTADVGDFAVARFNSDGSLDTTFDGDGKVTTDAGDGIGLSHDRPWALALQPDGKILVAGSSDSDAFNVVRYNADGSLDTTFAGNGKLETDVRGEWDEAHALAVQSDGKIVAAGYSERPGSIFHNDFALVRYDDDGSLDTGFESDGIVVTSFGDSIQSEANGLALQADGKIVAGGGQGFRVARYNSDGSLDTSFDGDGLAGVGGVVAHALALRSDGKIVLAGQVGLCGTNCDFGVVRFNANGSLDTGFDLDGTATVPIAPDDQIDIARGAVAQPDGRVVVAGYADMGPPEFLDIDFALIRFEPNGATVQPGTPTLSDTDPDSPANDTQPRVKGSTASWGVRLYTTSDCSGGAAASGTAAELASPGIELTVPSNATTSIRARGVDRTGNLSACSAPITYVSDSFAPFPPSFNDVDPESPANDNSPQLKGVAEPGSTVSIYTNSGCSGAPAASGLAADFGSTGIAVAVPDDSTTSFWATATDGAGNVSGCSFSTIAYTEDSTAPAAPALTDTDPDSPADSNNPSVRGSAEAGSTVTLYTSGDCSGAQAASGSAEQLAGPGLPVSVPDNATTTFRATATDGAGNASPCSAPISYVESTPGVPAPGGGGSGGGLPGPAPPGGSLDVAPPAIAQSAVARQTIASFLRRGLRWRVDCDEPCSVVSDLLIAARLARRLGIRPTGPLHRIARARGGAPEAGAVPLVLRARLSAAARRRLAGLRSVRMSVRTRAEDLEGNAARRTSAVTLRRRR